ncbi:CsbD family protein [Paraburkholderia caledonica]|uniref:CsbD family protein n=1 Tax=Paraburkholderia caledonica TaxID=134536 RepID=UPI000B48D6E6|nr:CsbD family protein [Burkholderia sp. Bk]
MANDKTEGIKEELKGMINKGIGSITGNEDRKLKGEGQITEGENRKDLGDQRENAEKGKTDPGNPSNL